MKHVLTHSKKILFISLLLNSSYYTYTTTPSKITPAKQTQKKNTKKKKSSGFIWKFSTGFLTGIVTLHILQKTLMNNAHISEKYCIYKQIKNLLKINNA